MKLTTANPRTNGCPSLPASNTVVLSFLVVLLVCNVVAVIWYRARSYRRKKAREKARQLAIGRARKSLEDKLKLSPSYSKNINNNNNIGQNFRRLHDANGCPVQMPVIQIYRDTDITNASTQSDLYAHVDRTKRNAAMASLNLPISAIPKPSGNFTDVFDSSKHANGFLLAHRPELKMPPSSTPAFQQMPQKQAGHCLPDSFYKPVSPVTPCCKNTSFAQMDTSNVFVSEGKEQKNKFSLTSTVRAFPNRFTSTLSSIGGGPRFVASTPLERPNDGAYVSFQENRQIRS